MAPRLKWGVERRLEFIEFRLYWDGGVNRSDIIDAFDVSVPQASKDFALYQERAPGNALYDGRLKRYVAGPHFRPVFTKLDASDYLARLESLLAGGGQDGAQSWIGAVPDAAAAPSFVRTLRPDILRAMLAAIREANAVEVFYQSFGRPEPIWRWVAPHALGFDGFRWHVRAFDEVRDGFIDLALARILDVRGRRPSEVRPADDTAWHETTTLVIAPNPRLTEGQKRAVAFDYDMTDGTAQITLRRAFVYYVKQRLGLTEGHETRRPEDQHIVLVAER